MCEKEGMNGNYTTCPYEAIPISLESICVTIYKSHHIKSMHLHPHPPLIVLASDTHLPNTDIYDIDWPYTLANMPTTLHPLTDTPTPYHTHLQCTTIGAVLSLYSFLTCWTNFTREEGWVGTPKSGQVVKWKCFTLSGLQ